ncbi:hypothetical protein D3C86_1758690 [compost metagenome]
MVMPICSGASTCSRLSRYPACTGTINRLKPANSDSPYRGVSARHGNWPAGRSRVVGSGCAAACGSHSFQAISGRKTRPTAYSAKGVRQSFCPRKPPSAINTAADNEVATICKANRRSRRAPL